MNSSRQQDEETSLRSFDSIIILCEFIGSCEWNCKELVCSNDGDWTGLGRIGLRLKEEGERAG